MTAFADLPPLADVFAFSSPDPEQRASVERRLAGETRFAAPWRPGGDWLVASAPFPGRPAEDDDTRAAGLAFAEGRQTLGHRAALGELRATLTTGGDLARHAGDIGVFGFEGPAVTAARSCGGLVPVWTWSDGAAAAVSTNLTVLLRMLPKRPEIDRLVTAMWGSKIWSFPWRRTPYRGVQLVPLGHSARWSGAGDWSFRAYWDPRDRAGGASRSERELTAELRELLLGSLRGGLADDATNLLTLSGGVDSSALAVLAGRTLGLPLVTLSLLPPVRTGEILVRDRGYVDRANAHAGVRRAFAYPMEDELYDGFLARRPPVAIPTAHPALLALPEVLEEQPVDVFFGGEYADDVCGHWWRLQDWIDATSPVAMLRGLRRLPYDRHDLLRWPKWKLRARLGRPRVPLYDDLLPMFAPGLREEYRQWRREMQAEIAADPRPNRYLAAQLRINSDSGIPTNWEILAPLGIRRLFPFHTREMLEHAGSADIRLMMGPGPKRTLRAALAPDVPAGLLLRPDKGQWGMTHDERARFAPQLDPRELPGLFDPGWRAGAGVTAPQRDALCYVSQIRSAR